VIRGMKFLRRLGTKKKKKGLERFTKDYCKNFGGATKGPRGSSRGHEKGGGSCVRKISLNFNMDREVKGLPLLGGVAKNITKKCP